MPTTPFDNLSNEAWGLTKIITDALTTKEIASLTTTCIALLHLFGPCLNKHAFDYFLQCIAYGEQSKAEAILRQHPDFLLKAGSVTGVPGQNKKPHITGILSAIEINKS
jgi:hypothetical protein